MRWGVPFAVLVSVCGVASACTTHGQACSPGDWQYCACASSKGHGYEQCADDGSGYGACDCSGAIPAGAGVLVDANAPPPDAGDAGGDTSTLLDFLAPCTDNAQCASGNCFPYNAYGPHCTIPCTKDSDCPAPSPGCSNRGVCKLH